MPPPGVPGRPHDSRLFKILRRVLAGTDGMRSKHGANLALDILAANGIAEIAVARGDGRLVHLATDDKVIASSVVRTGSFGRENMAPFVRLLADAGLAPTVMTFVNIGANIGTACLNAYDAGFRHLVAVEPEPRNFSLLERNLADLAGATVRCVPCAIGAEAGRAVLHQHPSNLGSHSLVAPTREASSAGTVEVAIRTLPEILTPGEAFSLFIDVEGFEPQVLRGGGDALATDCRAIVLEVTPGRMTAEDGADMCQRLAAFASELVLLPSGERHPSTHLGRLIEERRAGHFDIALLRG